MKGKYLLVLWIVLINANEIMTQSNLGFGSWESHLPYQRGLSITQSPTKIYYGTDWSIMSINKEDLSLEFISKVEGLSTLGISNVKYDPYTGVLFVIYSDSNMDILTEDGIINISDIKNNLGIIGDKRINDVHFDKSKKSFLSTGFGVVSYNMETFEFGFTTQMNRQVYNTTTDQDNYLFAATEDGLYKIDLSKNYNFGDFNNWEFVGVEEGLPLAYEAKEVAFYNGALFLNIDNNLYIKNSDQFELFYQPESGELIEFMNPDGQELMIGLRKEKEFSSRALFINNNLELSLSNSNCGNFINYGLMEDSGRIWYADEWNSFRYTDNKDAICQRFTAPSPFSHSVSEMRVEDGILYVASGGVSEGFNFSSDRNGIYILKEGQWLNYNDANTPFLKENEFINNFVLAPDPNSENIYLGSFFSGLAKANFEANTFSLFNSENSPIAGSGIPEIEKISGLAFDQEKNLWISVYEGNKPLIALTPEGTFHSFNISTGNRIGQIEIDDYGFKWIQVTGASGGVLVYDDNGTVKDPSDDRQRFFNSSNSNLESNIINCLKKDLNGDVWVGTGNGPIVFECGSNPFDIENCLGSIRRVLEDSIAALLLVTEDVRSIEIDGANRKWFGSRNGIFVQSSDGREKIDRFTIDNSPLFNNNILDMAYDGKSGLMYIASDQGIQSYQTLTTSGGKRHNSTTFAFPNPVRPHYDGLIAIRGLSRDAAIKITDIRGQLVHETFALGGQAHWDGRDYNGRKVSSGVYLVFSNSRNPFEDPNTAVTKLMIIR